MSNPSYSRFTAMTVGQAKEAAAKKGKQEPLFKPQATNDQMVINAQQYAIKKATSLGLQQYVTSDASQVKVLNPNKQFQDLGLVSLKNATANSTLSAADLVNKAFLEGYPLDMQVDKFGRIRFGLSAATTATSTKLKKRLWNVTMKRGQFISKKLLQAFLKDQKIIEYGLGELPGFNVLVSVSNLARALLNYKKYLDNPDRFLGVKKIQFALKDALKPSNKIKGQLRINGFNSTDNVTSDALINARKQKAAKAREAEKGFATQQAQKSAALDKMIADAGTGNISNMDIERIQSNQNQQQQQQQQNVQNVKVMPTIGKIINQFKTNNDLLSNNAVIDGNQIQQLVSSASALFTIQQKYNAFIDYANKQLQKKQNPTIQDFDDLFQTFKNNNNGDL